MASPNSRESRPPAIGKSRFFVQRSQGGPWLSGGPCLNKETPGMAGKFRRKGRAAFAREGPSFGWWFYVEGVGRKAGAAQNRDRGEKKERRPCPHCGRRKAKATALSITRNSYGKKQRLLWHPGGKSSRTDFFEWRREKKKRPTVQCPLPYTPIMPERGALPTWLTFFGKKKEEGKSATWRCMLHYV